MEDNEVVDREATRTFSSVDRPGSITMKNEPLAVSGQAVTVPVKDAVVSPELIPAARVQVAEAPVYALLVAYAIYSPSPVQISL
jgi:hypothetical protein